MIISDKYKYVFIQVPHTASTAIAEELEAFYDGRPILKKHSYIPDFERIASLQQKDYYIFGSIRNPLDERVSSYWKLRNDHLGLYSHHGELQDGVEDRASFHGRRRFRYIQGADADFEQYFKRFCKYTYDSPISLRKDRYDKVMRYESIVQDFDEVLRSIGINAQRMLPQSNRTAGRDREFVRYYSPAIIPQAVRIFGPFMEEWGYQWPTGWNEVDISWSGRFGYRVWGAARRAYWRTARFRRP